MDGNLQDNRSYIRRVFSDPVSVLLIIIMIAGSIFFWSQSRVPALNQKAQMGDRNNISAIAFDIVYPVHYEQPIVERVFKTTINWSYTNWKGMAFGLFFGVLALSLLQLHPPSNQTQNPLLNSLIGMTSGVPLGVCVNCATPIAQGMYLSGLRLETVLATLLSSPTLNVVVVTISFSLFPTYFVLTKILGSLVFILLVVPLVIKFTRVNQHLAEQASIEKKGSDAVDSVARFAEEMGEANQGLQRFNQKQQVVISGETLYILKRVVRLILENTIYLFKIAVPLMLLAGILGSILIETVPLQELTVLEYSLLSLLFVATVAVLLPVPIAFDVIAVSALLATGVSPGIAMTLLFSLGIFSIYPAMIIANVISFRLSLGLIAAVILFAITLGALTEQMSIKRSEGKLQQLKNELANIPTGVSTKYVATQICGSTDLAVQDACYVALIGSGSLGTQKTLCAQYLIAPDAIAQCEASSNEQTTTSDAIENKNTEVCLELEDKTRRDSCIIRVLITKSFDPDIVYQCRSSVDAARVNDCLENVYLKRIEGLANADACELPLLATEKAHCLQLLNGYKAAETRKLSNCTTATSLETGSTYRPLEPSQNNPTATRLCYSLIFAEAPEKQTSEFCQSLSSASNTQNCLDEITARVAIDTGDQLQCQQISAPWRQRYCQREIVARSFQLKLLNSTHSLIRNSVRPAVGSVPSKAFGPYIVAPEFNDDKIDNTSTSNNDISVQAAPYQHSGGDTEKTISTGRFVQHPGSEIGLKKYWKFKFTDFFDPFVLGRGIASGDFDNDGWSDIAIATNEGVVLYRNFGGLQFNFYGRLNLPQSLNSFVVTLVDLDNDGWLDVFATAYGGRSVVFNNQEGNFDKSNAIILYNPDANATLSAGFADWDLDGDLDFVLGNWSFGTEENFRTTFSANQRVTNNTNSIKKQSNKPYETRSFSELTGDTLSVLFSDINNDQSLDLILANDRHVPDLWYLGGTSGFELITPQRSDVVTSLNTMSYESADFNNDLLMDVFSSDMSFDDNGTSTYCHLLSGEDASACIETLPGAKAIQDLDITWCNALEDPDENANCLDAMTVRLATSDKDSSLCNTIQDESALSLCLRLAQHYTSEAPIVYDQYPLQQMSNKLLMGNEDGTFDDETTSAGVQSSYWSWNAKAADLDNDEYQDIYVGNGYEFGHPVQLFSNVFFHNKKDGSFERAEEAFNLKFMPNTSSFTYADFDRDGDIDIVTSSVMSQPFMFENQLNVNNSVQFSLRDHLGNRFAIGSKITIFYGEKLNQMREIKLSGGYQSFDETVVTFGLSSHTLVRSVEVQWPDGEITKLANLPGNARYRVTRK